MGEGKNKSNPGGERRPENIQDDFFERLRREQTPVVILLLDGTRLTGRLKSFDKFSLLVASQGQEQLLFKHAIATVSPAPKDAK